jgi:glucose-6-phosphate-specific signal transduction histidine kinase
MITAGVDGLIKDIEVTFVVPAVVLLLALLNIRFTPRSKYNALKLRLFLIVVLLMFAYCVSSVISQDSTVLKSLWLGNPVLYSFVYLLSGTLVIAGISSLLYWKLRPQLWRGKDRESVG